MSGHAAEARGSHSGEQDAAGVAGHGAGLREGGAGRQIRAQGVQVEVEGRHRGALQGQVSPPHDSALQFASALAKTADRLPDLRRRAGG